MANERESLTTVEPETPPRRLQGWWFLLLLALANLIWAAQGAGWFPYPKSSFMVDNSRWIYIGLGLWRQLPAGTDGAYKLMANLLSLGKK